MLFEHHIAIDWSGAGTSSSRCGGLAVAASEQELAVVAPPRWTTWSRDEIEAYLVEKLAPGQPRTIVAIDAALSLPDGFQQGALGCESWAEVVAEFGRLSAIYRTAREIGAAINARCGGGGPFRFNESRNDGSFYKEHGVAYFRIVDMLMPQCISPFYLGSGAAVGFHTITCLGSLHRLMERRATGEVAFHVWPQEGFDVPEDTHVLAECYPALYPRCADDELNSHQRDAMRAGAWLQEQDRSGRLAEWLAIDEPVVGRRKGRAWEDQVAFEGWVLGI